MMSRSKYMLILLFRPSSIRLSLGSSISRYSTSLREAISSIQSMYKILMSITREPSCITLSKYTKA